jgi:hypothetical protein
VLQHDSALFTTRERYIRLRTRRKTELNYLFSVFLRDLGGKSILGRAGIKEGRKDRKEAKIAKKKAPLLEFGSPPRAAARMVLLSAPPKDLS